MRVIEVEKKPLFFEEEKLSPEEKQYRDAVGLMESVDCVTRFERAVASLDIAAAQFEGLGSYKDSAERAKACKKEAESIRDAGIRETYDEAVKLLGNAKTKIDYRTAIAEFERIPDYKDSRERMEECKSILRRIANRQAWMGRGVVVLVLAVLAAIFWISPAKPFTKGLIRMKQGHYSMAINHFKEAGNFLNADSMRKKCRYKQAVKAYGAGNANRAMRLCRMADGRADADLLLARIEIEKIRGAEAGGTVAFGKRDWQVLAVDGDKMLLLHSQCLEHDRAFAAEGNEWASSRIRRWLNRTYKKRVLNQGERRLLQEASLDPEGEKTDKMYLLDSREYAQYADMITPAYRYQSSTESHPAADKTEAGEWWLRDAGSAQGFVNYVDAGGKIHTDGKVTEEKGVRPVIEIRLDEQLLEDTVATASPASE